MADSKSRDALAIAAASVVADVKRYREFALESECCWVELRKLHRPFVLRAFPT
ncbi:MAG: hypothetical protein ACR2RB_11830 [Gammaproteobacteria bacterium]